MRKLLLLSSLSLLSGCLPGGDDNTAPREFYEGQVLEIIVPFGPGGGTDIWARLMVPGLQQRLGNRSAVQVVNIPGGSSLAGTNEFAVRRRPDGRTALVSGASAFISALLGEPMIRYDFRDFAPIIGSPLGGVVYVSPGLGIRNASEIGNARTRLTYGGISPTGLDLVPLLAFELLGLEFLPILGYADRGAARLAFEQGETNIDYSTIPAYVSNVRSLVDQGLAIPLFTFGIMNEEGELVRDPAVPDLPSVREVYVDLFGREPEGVEWEAYKAVNAVGVSSAKVLWLHKNAPPEAIKALLAAAEDLSTDPDFRERARAEVGDYPFFVGDDVTRAIESATSVTPETLDWLLELLSSRYGLERLSRPQ